MKYVLFCMPKKTASMFGDHMTASVAVATDKYDKRILYCPGLRFVLRGAGETKVFCHEMPKILEKTLEHKGKSVSKLLDIVGADVSLLVAIDGQHWMVIGEFSLDFMIEEWNKNGIDVWPLNGSDVFDTIPEQVYRCKRG